MKSPNLCHVVVVSILLFVIFFVIPIFTSTQQLSNPWINACAYEKTWEEGMPGAVSLKIFRAWNEVEIVFVDYGFDGTLNEVRIPNKNGEAIHPNSPDWNMWLERYEKVREWATTGKKPEI